MKTVRSATILAMVLVAALLVTWAVQGYNIYTKTARPVTVTDELFGTTSVTWEPGFQLGLDIAGTATGVLVALVAGLWWYSRRMATRHLHA